MPVWGAEKCQFRTEKCQFILRNAGVGGQAAAQHAQAAAQHAIAAAQVAGTHPFRPLCVYRIWMDPSIHHTGDIRRVINSAGNLCLWHRL